MVIILYNAEARHEREVGFYRHDQWGFACLADEVRVLDLQRPPWRSAKGTRTVGKGFADRKSSAKNSAPIWPVETFFAVRIKSTDGKECFRRPRSSSRWQSIW